MATHSRSLHGQAPQATGGGRMEAQAGLRCQFQVVSVGSAESTPCCYFASDVERCGTRAPQPGATLSPDDRYCFR
jgi:hypothetical protein